jgi:hypothetical protein
VAMHTSLVVALIATSISISAAIVRLLSPEWKLSRLSSVTALVLTAIALGVAVLVVFMTSGFSWVALMVALAAYMCTSIPLVVVGLIGLSPATRAKLRASTQTTQGLQYGVLLLSLVGAFLLWRLIALRFV